MNKTDHLHSPDGNQWTKDLLIQKKDEKGYQVTARFKTQDGDYRVVRMSTQSGDLQKVCQLVESLRQVSLTMSGDRFQKFFAAGVELRNQTVTYEGGASQLVGLVRIENGRAKDVAQRMDRDAQIHTFLVEHDPINTKEYFTINLGKASGAVKGGRIQWLARQYNQMIPMGEKLGVVTNEQHIKDMAEFWTRALDDKQSIFNAEDWNEEVAERVGMWQHNTFLDRKAPILEVPYFQGDFAELRPEDLPAVEEYADTMVARKEEAAQEATHANLGAVTREKAQKELELVQAQRSVVCQEIMSRNILELSSIDYLPAYLVDRFGGDVDAAAAYQAAVRAFHQDHPLFQHRLHLVAEEMNRNVMRQVTINGEIRQELMEAKRQNREPNQKLLNTLKAERSMREVQLKKLVEQSNLATEIAEAMILLPPASPLRHRLGQRLNELFDAMYHVVLPRGRQPLSTQSHFVHAQDRIQDGLLHEVSNRPGWKNGVQTELRAAAGTVQPFRMAGGPPDIREILGRSVPRPPVHGRTESMAWLDEPLPFGNSSSSSSASPLTFDDNLSVEELESDSDPWTDDDEDDYI